MSDQLRRKVFIAHTHNGPVSVVLAPSREHAETFWAGLGVHPHHTEEIDPDEYNPFTVIAIVGVNNVDRWESRRHSGESRWVHAMVRGRGEEPK